MRQLLRTQPPTLQVSRLVRALDSVFRCAPERRRKMPAARFCNGCSGPGRAISAGAVERLGRSKATFPDPSSDGSTRFKATIVVLAPEVSPPLFFHCCGSGWTVIY